MLLLGGLLRLVIIVIILAVVLVVVIVAVRLEGIDVIATIWAFLSELLLLRLVLLRKNHLGLHLLTESVVDLILVFQRKRVLVELLEVLCVVYDLLVELELRGELGVVLQNLQLRFFLHIPRCKTGQIALSIDLPAVGKERGRLHGGQKLGQDILVITVIYVVVIVVAIETLDDIFVRVIHHHIIAAVVHDIVVGVAS